MARIRTIKPEFWTSEQIVECSPNARLMFIGLMNFADDNGVHPAKPMRIKMQVFPGDAFSSDDISSFISELDDAGLINTYEVDGEDFLQITGFSKHQKIDQPSYKFPLPNGKVPENPRRRRSIQSTDKTDEQTANSSERSENVRRTDGECSHPEGNGKEGNGKEIGADAPAGKPAKVSVTAKDLVSDYGISQQHAAEWLAVRKAKRLTLTKTAMDNMINEAAKAGLTLNDAVQMCIKKSWGGFEARFLNGNHGNGQAAETPRQRAMRMAAERGIQYEPQ